MLLLLLLLLLQQMQLQLLLSDYIFMKFFRKFRGTGGTAPKPADSFTAWQKLSFDAASVVADPRLIDATKGNFRLAADSPAVKLGFEEIPLDRIGPYADPRRATWPIAP